jgi:hypothetical protein
MDPRDVYVDEVLAGDDSPLPTEYLTKGLEFEGQGAYPFCVAFATTKMVEYFVKIKYGIKYNLSQVHLFFMSGGNRNGTYFRAALEAAKNVGLVSYAKLPMPSNIWEITDSSFNALKAQALITSLDDVKKIDGYARVKPDIESLKRAIRDHGMVMVGVAASGGWWTNLTKRSKEQDNHAVLLVGWKNDVFQTVFDSLQNSATFDGYHNLAYSYTFSSAYVVAELPDNWKELRDEARKGNEDRYGLPRDFPREVTTANEMLLAFQKFGNKSVMDAAGRFWEQSIRAICYGGYSITDVINSTYNWRRTGKHIFDFNQLRSEYKKP